MNLSFTENKSDYSACCYNYFYFVKEFSLNEQQAHFEKNDICWCFWSVLNYGLARQQEEKRINNNLEISQHQRNLSYLTPDEMQNRQRKQGLKQHILPLRERSNKIFRNVFQPRIFLLFQHKSIGGKPLSSKKIDASDQIER